MTPLEILEFYEGSIEREEGKEPCVTINADDYAAVLTGFREAVEERDRLLAANAQAAQGRRDFRQAYRNIMRETAILKRVKERYGLALMMIREGCAQPAKVAREALAWEPPEQEIANLDAALTERSKS